MRFAALWYQLTQWITGLLVGRGNHRIPPARTVDEVPVRFDWGRRWRPDPKFDILYHPRWMQRRIDRNDPKGLGDCEDHGAYWIATLVRSGLFTADQVHLGIIKFKHNGKRSGHAFCVIIIDGVTHWCDYGVPKPVDDGPWWQFGMDVARAFESPEVYAISLWPVESVNADDTVDFDITRVKRIRKHLVVRYPD